ncbi:hypothetical protein D9756_010837 [Leucocoprinus leucothites]|uniref:DUF6535 domain-containing protein n=1 Tax=Leucocoprinus leucothites TaxID=201217 RepID=A0A8H5FR45_9AGAR|nr:hypothetical protein D9756_010837 [Leucoagaricus leucothites]
MSTEQASKKRKTRSSCSRIELSSAFLVLQRFKDTITTQTETGGGSFQSVDNDELDVEVDRDTLAQLNGLLQWMDSKIKSTTKHHTFPSITSDVLSDIQLSQGLPLTLKSDWKERVEAARLVGANQFMSSADMRQFLNMLLHLVARPSEASARTWVDAFLYRVSAMLPPGKRMSLTDMEYTISPVTIPTASGTDTTLVGYRDYTAIISTPKMAEYFLNNPRVTDLARYIDSVLVFFMIEAKSEAVKLHDCLPHVLAQLYTSAKKLKKTHTRGALTNGYEWLFVMLTVNSDSKGASYRISARSYSAAPQDAGGDVVVPNILPDMIAGILATWVSTASAFTLVDERVDTTIDDEKTWSCEDDYRYPLKESIVDPWEQCYDIVDGFDEDLVKGVKDEISNLLVVASLFLAVVTAFLIESGKLLQAEPAELTAVRLGQVVQLLNSTDAGQRTVPPYESPPPSRASITINQLWYMSFFQSLAAVILGTLCLQWLSAFTHRTKGKTQDRALALRQMRYEGLIGWGVPHVPAVLLLNVQAALILFAVGLLELLWTENKDVAFPVAIVAGVTIFLLVLTTMLPLLQSITAWICPSTLVIPQCPFKSPVSWIIHRSAVLLALGGSFLVQLFVGGELRQRIYRWRREQVPLLTDTNWEEYDELWRRKREERGPQAHAEANDHDYSHYLARGLAAVMDALIAKPSAVHIVHNCLQDVHGSRAQAKTFKSLFRQSFTTDEEDLLATASIAGEDFFTLRKDFLSAHVLQYFVAHNEKLHKTVLKHRAELFIRINNTACQSKVEVGKTIMCPITSQKDATRLALGTRRQFLECIKNILGNRHISQDELHATRAIILSIDLRVHVSARFHKTIQDLAKELAVWRTSRGDTWNYNQTLQAIVVRFPQLRNQFGMEADEKATVGVENVHASGDNKVEFSQGQEQDNWEERNSGDEGRLESHPLVMVGNQRRRRDGH